MKKFFVLVILMSFVLTPTITCVQATTTQTDVEAPKWEEYVPEKYQEPRSFPNRGKNIAELVVGIVLTDLIVTSPVGVPMIVHSTTKMKNQGWYEKKQIYDAGLIEAEKITDPQAKAAFYEDLKKKCIKI